MKRLWINYLIDIGMLISFIICAITGIFKWPGLIEKFGMTYADIPYEFFTSIHDWSGLILVLLVFFHVLLHWNWIIAMTKRIFKGVNIFKALVITNILILTLGYAIVQISEKHSARFDDIEPKQINSESLKNQMTDEEVKIQKKVDLLEGTCPRGLNCGTPFCGLWSDFDENGFCDRGVL